MSITTWQPDQPLDLDACFARFTRWGNHPLVRFHDGVAYRAVSRRPEPALLYSAHQRPDGTVVIESDDPAAALADLRFRLADHVDRAPIEALAARDQAIGREFAARRGYRLPLEPDLFVALVGLVAAQQVNLSWANTTLTRIVHDFGTIHRWHGLDLWEFPAADTLGGTDPQRIRDLQLTSAKAQFIVGIAHACATGTFDDLASLDDEEATAMLTGVRGIGRWTADWVLARHLGRPNVVAAGDLGVRKAVAGYTGADQPLPEPEVRAITRPWGNAASWAVHLLLEALNDG